MNQNEFIRNVFLYSISDGNQRHETVYIHDPKQRDKKRIFCTCDRRKTHATCRHADHVIAFFERLRSGADNQAPHELFQKSFWYRILQPAISSASPSVYSVSVRKPEIGYEIVDRNGTVLLSATGNKELAARFLSRAGKGRDGAFTDPLMRLREFVLTDTERNLISGGRTSTRMAKEDSLWYRLAYHLFMESYNCSIDAESGIDQRNGDFKITASGRSAGWQITVTIPRQVTASIAREALCQTPDSSGFSWEKGEREVSCRIISVENDRLKIECGIVISSGKCASFQVVRENYVYGNAVYCPDIRTFISLSAASRGVLGLRMHDQPAMHEESLSKFIETNAGVLSTAVDAPGGQIDLFSETNAANFARIVAPPIITEFTALELEPVSLEEQECSFRIWCVYPGGKLALARLMSAFKKDHRFLIEPGAIIDMRADAIASLRFLGTGISGEGILSMPRSHLLRFTRTELRISLAAENRFSAEIASMMELCPLIPLCAIRGLETKLRSYQKRAVEWLMFLYDNYLGGLLCDEMGLGKTIEALGMMVATKAQRNSQAPMLVICPTSVISHWQQSIKKFAPRLDVSLYHGPDRSISDCAQIVVTSYGIMRNDADRLHEVQFAIIVFDEIQNLKNRATGYFEAAQKLRARCRIGCTGTPVENSIADLKSLFDTVLPGYFGDETMFVERFLEPIEKNDDHRVKLRFRRFTSPFILRRLKKDVLTELPEKIENLYPCSLSRDQETLYRQVALGEGGQIIALCRDKNARVPYMHAFHVLNKLKQICDHPAVYHKISESYRELESGKFELFRELLREALDSGEKVAVFSQYLRMIDIIGIELASLRVGYVCLTGASMNRGEILREFNENPGCRVFVGSLKAGGAGIDLTAASVLIHYDRWWNAAREDQATDRVHRIGQKKAVQIIKMITVHTIEERIDRIIARKRALASDALSIDDPNEAKIFTREELIEILEEKQ